MDKCSEEKGKERSSSNAETLRLAAPFGAHRLQMAVWDSTPLCPDAVLQEASSPVMAAESPGQCCPCLGAACDSCSCLLFAAPAEKRNRPQLCSWVLLISAIVLKASLISICLGGFLSLLIFPGDGRDWGRWEWWEWKT